MRRTIAALVACAVAVSALAATAAGSGLLPDRIALPDGFQPEGIAIVGPTFYVGSIPTGAVYRGSLLSGRGAVLVPGREGRAAIGVEVRRGQIVAAGGPTGNAFVYDARTGDDVAAFDLATAADTFVNDVVVTREAAFFTDSRQPVLYRVELERGRLSPRSEVRRIPLTGDLRYQDGFNLNGIDATGDGTTLIAVQSNTGLLFTIDPDTGSTRRIDLAAGESVPNGDGVLLLGRTLYVVQNRLNAIAKLRLAPDLASGSVLRRITSPDFDVPTTIDRFGPWLYAVNARFGTAATPTTEYWVTRVRR